MRTRSIIIHIITEIIDSRYATSVRAFGPDKKPQFLECSFPRVNNHNRGAFVLTGRGYIKDMVTPGWRPKARSLGVRGKADGGGSEG